MQRGNLSLSPAHLIPPLLFATGGKEQYPHPFTLSYLSCFLVAMLITAMPRVAFFSQVRKLLRYHVSFSRSSFLFSLLFSRFRAEENKKRVVWPAMRFLRKCDTYFRRRLFYKGLSSSPLLVTWMQKKGKIKQSSLRFCCTSNRPDWNGRPPSIATQSLVTTSQGNQQSNVHCIYCLPVVFRASSLLRGIP